MEFFHAIKAKALRDVVLPESKGEYTLRHIFRWYSKTFHTPLHLVDDLPLEDVLRAYFEEKYEGFDQDEIEEEIRALTESKEEKAARLRAEEDQRLTDKLFQEAVEKREAARMEAKPDQAPIVEVQKPRQKGIAEVELPETKVAEQPLIKMTFLSDAELDALSEGHGMMTQPDKK